MATVGPLILHMKFSWWVKPYLYACITFAWLTGMEPNLDKITGTVMRDVKFRLETK